VYNSTWLSDNVLEVYTKDFWRVNKTSIEQGYSRVVDGLYGLDRNVITYVDCSTQIWYQESQLDQAVLNSINKNIFGTLSPPDICTLAQASCAGSLYPFDTVHECIQFMQDIPVACNDGQNSLRGNTSNCRYLHAVAASVAPTVHCPHVSKDSTFCTQDSCIGQEYGPLPPKRLGQRSDMGEDNAGYQITSVSVLAFIVGFLPAAIYLVYLAAGVLQMRRVKGALLEDGYTAVAGDVAPSPVTKSPTQLRVHDFGYTTLEGRQLLLDVNFKASGGDIIAVMGPSGAGKTTLLKSLAGIPMPGTHRGGVLYDEVSVMDSKSKLAFVPQYPEKVNLCQPLLTAREFLIVQALSVYQQLLADKVPVDGLTRDEFVADSIARVVQAMSLATFLDTQVNRLSGGQHKRLSAAYHLISDPRVLILDEPTSGLDSFAAASMMASLRQLAMKRSMLIIASIHQPPNTIMAEFDYVLLMKAGGVSIVYEKAPLLLDRQEDLHQRVRVFANTNQGMCSVVSSTVVAAVLLSDMEMTGEIELGAGGSLLAVADVLAILGNAKGCVSVEEASNVLRTEAEAPKYKTNGGRDALIGLAGIMDALVRREVELTHAIDTSSLGSLLLCTAELAAVVSGNFAAFRKSLVRFRSFKSFKSLELDQRGELTDWTLVPLVEGASSLRHRMNLIPILAWSHWQATPKLDQLVYHVGCFVAAGFMAMMYPQLRVQAARELYGFASSFLVLLAIVSNLVFLNQVLQRISREREMLAQAYTARGDSLAVRVVTMLLCNSASSVVSLMLMFWLYFFVVGWDVLHLSFASLINSMLSMKIVLDLMAMFGTVRIDLDRHAIALPAPQLSHSLRASRYPRSAGGNSVPPTGWGAWPHGLLARVEYDLRWRADPRR